MKQRELLRNLTNIYTQAAASDDGQRCAVAPSPDLGAKIKDAIKAAQKSAKLSAALTLKAVEEKLFGLNDGVIVPPEVFPLGTAPSVMRAAAADRAPLRGTLRVIVMLVDFSDKHMAQTAQHYKDLFFSLGVVPTKSVREYYREVTNGLIDIQGDVVGPFRLPQTIVTYAHGASGMTNQTPNAQTMAFDTLTAANPSVNFSLYDNDGNGFVDAFIVIHAGSGAEETGSANDIWSHKWVIAGGAQSVDGTKVYGYLTVPEDCKIGVCAHELGHLLFGFPDLYDTDNSSEGIGNWCLMAAGSWGGGGNTPVHPSAWCKANQGWVSVDNRTANSQVSIADVKDSHTIYRLWKDGAAGQEYFLVENRQQHGFDASLPGSGLLIWHIDESASGNTDENHYKVALMQADGQKDLEKNVNRGDAGDCFPGSKSNSAFTGTSNPNSKSYGNASTCVAVTGISASGPVMTANLQCKCGVVKRFSRKELIKEGDKIRKEIMIEKPLIDTKNVLSDKRVEKPITDKSASFDKGLVENKLGDNKLGEGRPGGGQLGGSADLTALEARISALEALANAQQQPFIDASQRPDLSQGALSEEEDQEQLRQQMLGGSAEAKRLFDAKPPR